MKLGESSFVLCHTFITSCVIISCSLFWSSLLFKTAYAENNDKTNLNVNESPFVNSHSWRANHKLSPIIKFLKQSEHFSKRQSNDDLPPPGFIGVRGRRENRLWDWGYAKGKRNLNEDYQTLTEVFPDLLSHLNDEDISGSADELMAARLASGKKSDSIVYKDGFLGVRG